MFLAKNNVLTSALICLLTKTRARKEFLADEAGIMGEVMGEGFCTEMGGLPAATIS